MRGRKAGMTMRCGLVGLGSMGSGMAASLVAGGVTTWGFDIDEARVTRFREGGGQEGSLREVAGELDALVLVVVNADQMRDVLFGDAGIARALKPGCAVLGCATMAPDAVRALAREVEAAGLLYLDSPISGGPVKAAEGRLTIMASGSDAAFAAAGPALDAMAETVFELGRAPGQGAAMKVVNQLLAGVHIAAAAEAITFALAQGIDPATTVATISKCAGTSWMFENRGPHIAQGDYTPHSSVEIFVKDLGIVDDVARSSRFSAPLAAAALHQFLAAAGMGLGGEDDSAVAKVYARNARLALPGEDT